MSSNAATACRPLAKRFYGRLSKRPILYVACRTVIGHNPDLVRPGQVLWAPGTRRAEPARIDQVPRGPRTAWPLQPARRRGDDRRR